MIYLIKSNNFYKIGFTNNLENRLNSYRTSNPNFELIGFKSGNLKLEKYYHKLLNDFRIDKREWFDITDKLILNNLINEFTNVDPNILCTKFKIEPSIPEEIYSYYRIIKEYNILTYYLTTKKFVVVINGKELYELVVDSIQTFILNKDYETFEGIVINNELIIYNYINKETKGPFLETASIISTNSILYKILVDKNLLKDYKFI